MHVDVAVVGAGMAGIAAALEAREAGRSVVLIDPSPGGLLRTVNGHEVGPQSLLGSADDVWWVLEQLQLINEVVPLPSRLPRFLVRDGRLCAISASPVSLLTTSALTWSERLSLGRELVRGAHGAADGESVQAFIARRFGESFAAKVAATALTGVFATPIDSLEAKSALPAWVEAERTKGSVIRGLISGHRRVEGRPASYRLRGGFSSIGTRAAGAVRHVPLAANRLRRTPSGWQVTNEVLAQTVVIATAPASLESLVGGALPRFEQVSIAVVHWTSTESKLPKGFGYLANPADGLFSLGCIFTGDLDGTKPSQFASFVGGAWHPERVGLDDGAMRRGIEGDLQQLTGGRVEAVLHVERWALGFTPPRLGHAARVAALRSAVERDGVFLAGGYLGSGTVRDAASFGRQAGRAAVAQLVATPEASAA